MFLFEHFRMSNNIRFGSACTAIKCKNRKKPKGEEDMGGGWLEDGEDTDQEEALIKRLYHLSFLR